MADAQSYIKEFDKSIDGKISRDEMKGQTTGFFTRADKNSDSSISG